LNFSRSERKKRIADLKIRAPQGMSLSNGVPYFSLPSPINAAEYNNALSMDQVCYNASRSFEKLSPTGLITFILA
jgi:hypothetical protein